MASIGNVRVTRAGIIFIIVAIVLAIVVFASVSFVKQRGEQVRRDEAVDIAQQNLENEAQTPIAIAEDGESIETTSPPAEESASATSGSNTGELPQTGPELINVIVIALLAGAATYYVASRRAVREL